MLQALLEQLQDGLPASNEPQTPWDVLQAARSLLLQSPLFQAAVQQLSSRNVEGCIKDEQRAQHHRLEGNQLFKLGDWARAVQEYTCALRYLDVGGHPAAAAKLHLNRALAALQAATAAAAAAAAAAEGTATAAAATATADPGPRRLPVATACSTGAGLAPTVPTVPNSSSSPEEGDAQSISRSTCQRCREGVKAAAAAAAVEDLSAALLLDPASAAKVHYRRATAHLLLDEVDAAVRDVASGLAAAAAAGDAAGQQEFQRLQQRLPTGSVITAGAAAGSSDCSRLGSQTPGVQEHQHAQVEHKTVQVCDASVSLPAGPTLHQLQQLLAAAAMPTTTPSHGRITATYDSGSVQEGTCSPSSSGESAERKISSSGGNDICSSSSSSGGTDIGSRSSSSSGGNGVCSSSSGDEQPADPLLVPAWDVLQGRHLVAGRSIGPGHLLLQESPLAALPTKAVRHSRCWCCLGPLGAAPHYCPSCPLAVYCSWRCAQQDSQQQHVPGGAECSAPWAQLLPEPAVLATRVWAAQHFGPSKQPLGQWQSPGAKDADMTARRGAAGDGRLLVLVQSLVTGLPLRQWLHGTQLTDTCKPATSATVAQAQQQQQQQQHTVRQALQQAALAPDTPGWADLLELVLLAVLTAETYAACLHSSHITRAATQPMPAGSRHTFLQQQQQQGQQVAAVVGGPSPSAAELLVLLSQLQANGIAVRPLLSSSTVDRLGLGLYPLTAAVVNHSCDPTCELRFQGNQLLLRTVKPVRPGQQLTISYGPQAGERATSARRQQLLEAYGFWCSCAACEAAAGVRGDSGMTQREAAAVGLRCSQSSCAGTCVPTTPAALGVISRNLGVPPPTPSPTTSPPSSKATSSAATSSRTLSGGRSRAVGVGGVLPCSVCGDTPDEGYLAAAMAALLQAAHSAQEGVAAADQALQQLQGLLGCHGCTLRGLAETCLPVMYSSSSSASRSSGASGSGGSTGSCSSASTRTGTGSSGGVRSGACTGSSSKLEQSCRGLGLAMQSVLQQLQEAVACLQAACEVRQRWLHPDNHLLGQTYHQLSGVHAWRGGALWLQEVQRDGDPQLLQVAQVLLQCCQLLHPAAGGEVAAVAVGGSGVGQRGAPASKPSAAGGSRAAGGMLQWQLPETPAEQQLQDLAGACRALSGLAAAAGQCEKQQDGTLRAAVKQQAAAVEAAVRQVLHAAPMPGVCDLFQLTEAGRGTGKSPALLELRAAWRHSRSSGRLVLHSFEPHSTQLGASALEVSILGLLVAAAEAVSEPGAGVM